jgi:hypothetical protein
MCDLVGNADYGAAAEPVFDDLFQDPDQENDGGVDDGLEQDRSDQRSRVEAAEERQQVGQQHGLSHNRRSRRCDEVVGETGHIVVEDKLRREFDQVETDREKQYRRQDFLDLLDDERTGTRRDLAEFLQSHHTCCCCCVRGSMVVPENRTGGLPAPGGPR